VKAHLVEKGLRRRIEAISLGIAGVGVACLIALTLIITYEVVMRYVWNKPTMFADEIASYLMVGIVFLGMPHTLSQGAHVQIDILTGLMPTRLKLIFEIICDAVSVAFAGILVAGAWYKFENYWSRGTVSDTILYTPMYLPAIPLVIGAIAFALVASIALVRHVQLALTGAALESEQKS
jgi:TRAP-type C4-dicarboxylate transport system permease small subunit